MQIAGSTSHSIPQLCCGLLSWHSKLHFSELIDERAWVHITWLIVTNGILKIWHLGERVIIVTVVKDHRYRIGLLLYVIHLSYLLCEGEGTIYARCHKAGLVTIDTILRF